MTGYRKPDVNLLKRTAPIDTTVTDEHKKRTETLRRALTAYGLPGDIVGTRPGPMVSTYEFRPEMGVRIADIMNATADLARATSARHMRVAHIPGTDLVGLETDNERPRIIRIGDLVAGTEFAETKRRIPLAMGVNSDGAPMYGDLAKMPHLMITGRTGSGKSVFLQSVIMSVVYRFTPDECKLLIIDPKGADFGHWDDVPHLVAPVIKQDADAALNALSWTVREINRRHAALQTAGANDIEAFNKTAPTRMPYIVVIVDELADLMATARHTTESCVQRIAQKARAVGIHLILATQRSDSQTISDVIKANFPSRVSFRARNATDAITCLGEQGAEYLLDWGDMLFSDAGRTPVRVHTAFIDDDEIAAVAEHLRKQGKPEYIDGITDNDDADTPEPDFEELCARAREIVIRDNKPTISYLQRQLMIGYNKAAAILEQMEREGIVSAPDENGKRHLL